MKEQPEQADLFAETLELPDRLASELDSIKHLLEDGDPNQLIGLIGAGPEAQDETDAATEIAEQHREHKTVHAYQLEQLIDTIVDREVEKVRCALKKKILTEVMDHLDPDAIGDEELDLE